MANRAFTIIELILVAVIITILASIGMLRYFNVIEKSRSAEAYAVLANIAESESSYFTENNAYTSDITQLDRFNAVPLSDNFDFEVSSTDSSAGYTSAKGKGSALHSYGRCLGSNKKTSCAVGIACNPGCP